jgi:hypothetical protein
MDAEEMPWDSGVLLGRDLVFPKLVETRVSRRRVVMFFMCKGGWERRAPARLLVR